jgi:hypothetical protein
MCVRDLEGKKSTKKSSAQDWMEWIRTYLIVSSACTNAQSLPFRRSRAVPHRRSVLQLFCHHTARRENKAAGVAVKLTRPPVGFLVATPRHWGAPPPWRRLPTESMLTGEWKDRQSKAYSPLAFSFFTLVVHGPARTSGHGQHGLIWRFSGLIRRNATSLGWLDRSVAESSRPWSWSWSWSRRPPVDPGETQTGRL